MATITVTNTNDTGAGSLRDAVAQANANADADTIVFSAALAGQTIALSTGELKLSNDVTIDGDVDGDNKADITISGSNLSRIFNIDTAGTDVDLLSLTLSNGRSGGFGGAIYTTSNITLDIADSTIRNSQASKGGGIYVNGNDVVSTVFTATNVTMYGNQAGGNGGAVYADGLGPTTFTNCTIVGNSSGIRGGGIYACGGNELTLINSTVTGNSALIGGGIGSYVGGVVTIQNSVVAANSATISGTDIGFRSTSTNFSANHSFFGTDVSPLLDSSTANTQNGGNPGLGPLADNGGTVKTMLPGVLSPLVDTGDSSLAPLGEAANGIPRIVGPAVDIGAAESVPEHLVVTISNDEDDGNYAPDDLSLREAIKLANSNADANTITFDAGLAGQLLVLTGGELAITSDVTVDGDVTGDNKADITLSGNDQNRIFNINGGVIDVTLASLTLTDGKGNNAGLFGTRGGAVLVQGNANLNITDSTIRDSSSYDNGGGIFIDGNLRAENVLFSGNEATGSLIAAGGAVFVRGASGVSNNSAVFVGCTVVGNSAQYTAGGIGGGANVKVDLLQTSILGNTALRGGGVSLSGGATSNVFNSVIADNSATIYSDFRASPSNSSLTFSNSIFSSAASGVTSGANGNLVLIGATATSLGLGALGDHGGRVQTLNIIDPNSVLIDAGDNNLVPLTLSYDANGNPRIQRGTVDIGATEYANTAPSITDTSFRIVENRSLIGPVPATDAENDTLAFTIVGGKDAGLFDIDGATGALSFKAAPDFENPADFDGDNVYEVRVSVSDGFGGTDTELISVRVTNGNDRPVITSDGGKLNATVSVAENATAVTKVVASDPDGSSIGYAISGGDDKALFSIDATTGKVTFKSAPDFEAPQDKNHDNAYQITIRATDSDGAIDVQYLTVKVTDTDGVSITGTSAADTVNANKTVAGQPAPTGEEDHIRGLGGKDILNGLGGDDILEGGAAKDRLKGGIGHDCFVYLAVTDSSAATGIDVITGFVQGDDTIDLSAIDGDFHFLGEAGFDGTAGALRQRTAGSDVFLEGDTDGNGVADLVILLKGSAGLVLTDGDLGL